MLREPGHKLAQLGLELQRVELVDLQAGRAQLEPEPRHFLRAHLVEGPREQLPQSGGQRLDGRPGLEQALGESVFQLFLRFFARKHCLQVFERHFCDFGLFRFIGRELGAFLRVRTGRQHEDVALGQEVYFLEDHLGQSGLLGL